MLISDLTVSGCGQWTGAAALALGLSFVAPFALIQDLALALGLLLGALTAGLAFGAWRLGAYLDRRSQELRDAYVHLSEHQKLMSKINQHEAVPGDLAYVLNTFSDCLHRHKFIRILAVRICAQRHQFEFDSRRMEFNARATKDILRLKKSDPILMKLLLDATWSGINYMYCRYDDPIVRHAAFFLLGGDADELPTRLGSNLVQAQDSRMSFDWAVPA